MQKATNLAHLKHALSSIEQQHQGIAATIGLLASSGLNPTQQMPEMCHLLQKLFRLNSCGFFWSDQAGNMQDAWCTTTDFLSFKTLTSCLEYQNAGDRTWPPFQENVLMGAVAGYLLPFQNERFYASPHFQKAYQPNNIRHILDVVLHDGTRPFGAFLMMRSAQQGPFIPDERRLLVQLIPIMNMAFSTPSAGETHYAEKALTGFALVGQDGKFKSMSEEARRIVWTLTHAQPGSFVDPNDPSIEQYLEQRVDEHRARIQDGEKFSMDLANRWGRFSLTFEKEPKTLDTILCCAAECPWLLNWLFVWPSSIFRPCARSSPGCWRRINPAMKFPAHWAFP